MQAHRIHMIGLDFSLGRSFILAVMLFVFGYIPDTMSIHVPAWVEPIATLTKIAAQLIAIPVGVVTIWAFYFKFGDRIRSGYNKSKFKKWWNRQSEDNKLFYRLLIFVATLFLFVLLLMLITNID